MHREKLTEVRGAKVAVLLAPGGRREDDWRRARVQRVVQVLKRRSASTTRCCSRIDANTTPHWRETLRLQVARRASRKSSRFSACSRSFGATLEPVVLSVYCTRSSSANGSWPRRESLRACRQRVHLLVAPFEDGPRRVRVEGRRLVLDAVGDAEVVNYALVVVDEAHHLVSDAAVRAQLADIGAAQTRLLLLADASQATATLAEDAIARSLVDLPQEQKVAVATLSEVVRSTKRIVAGAAAFQLEAGRKAETETHTASVGPPLVARIFNLADGEDTSEHYAREVVEALSAVQEQLADLSDLDDRVAVVGPDEAFIEKLRGPFARALVGSSSSTPATASVLAR